MDAIPQRDRKAHSNERDQAHQKGRPCWFSHSGDSYCAVSPVRGAPWHQRACSPCVPIVPQGWQSYTIRIESVAAVIPSLNSTNQDVRLTCRLFLRIMDSRDDLEKLLLVLGRPRVHRVPLGVKEQALGDDAIP